jgi:hypothetical protein
VVIEIVESPGTASYAKQEEGRASVPKVSSGRVPSNSTRRVYREKSLATNMTLMKHRQ